MRDLHPTQTHLPVSAPRFQEEAKRKKEVRGQAGGDAEAVQGRGEVDRQAAYIRSSSFLRMSWPKAGKKSQKYHLGNSPRSIVSW